MSKRRAILILVEDPGAANFVAGMIAPLRHSTDDVRLMACGHARDVLRAQGVEFVPWPDGAEAASVLASAQPVLVVVGTSENPRGPGLELIDAARTVALPAVAVVDAPGNAAYRFRGESEDPLRHAPDVVLVPDAGTAGEYQALGLTPRRIRVVGHPQFDRIRAMREEWDREGQRAVRRRVLPPEAVDRDVVVFVSEISGGLNPEQYRRSADYTLRGRGDRTGRTEIVLEEFLDAMADMPSRPYLVLRLHPKNRREEFQQYLDEFDLVSSGGSPLELVYAADLVAGMTTNLLLEAVLLLRPTLSILPRAVERAWLTSIEAGLTPAVTTRAELREFLDRRRKRPLAVDPAPVNTAMPPGACDRAVAALLSMAGRSSTPCERHL